MKIPFGDMKERFHNLKGTRWGRFVLVVLLLGGFIAPLLFTITVWTLSIFFSVISLHSLHDIGFLLFWEVIPKIFIFAIFISTCFWLYGELLISFYSKPLDEIKEKIRNLEKKNKKLHVLLPLLSGILLPIVLISGIFIGTRLSRSLEEGVVIPAAAYQLDLYSQMEYEHSNYPTAARTQKKLISFIDSHRDYFWNPDASKGRALARLSIINKKMGKPDKSESYMKEAQECLKKGGWDDVSAEKIEKWVEKSWQ